MKENKIFVQGKFHRENSFHKNNLESSLFYLNKTNGACRTKDAEFISTCLRHQCCK